jgi:hypothetical protein
MDKIIKEMTAKRNYEVEQINYNYNTQIEKADSWLKPQETSIKSDKFVRKDNNTLEMDSQLKKNVTWGENKEIEQAYLDLEEQSIFSKLKRVKQKLM